MEDDRQALLAKLQAQIGLQESMQQEKQVLEEAYNKISADYTELQQQISELETVRRHNEELGAQVEALSRQLSREHAARQNAERALAQLNHPHSPLPEPPNHAKNPLGASDSEKGANATPSAQSAFNRPGFAQAPNPSRANGPALSPPQFFIATNAVRNLAKSGTGAISDTAEKSLAAMRRSLPFFARHPESLEVLAELCQQIDTITEETAKAGILNLHQITTALRILLHDMHNTQSLINSSSLRSVGQAIDFILLLSKKENISRLKTLPPATILAVDDEGIVLEILASQMKSIALNLCWTKEPTQVIPLLKQHRFNLLLLDIAMDELNGLELCPQIRQLPGYSRTPIVFLTGMNSPEIRAQSTLVGGNDFINKPFLGSEIRLKTIFWALKDQMG